MTTVSLDVIAYANEAKRMDLVFRRDEVEELEPDPGSIDITMSCGDKKVVGRVAISTINDARNSLNMDVVGLLFCEMKRICNL